MIPKVTVEITRQPNERLSAFVVQDSASGPVHGEDLLSHVSPKITNIEEAKLRARSILGSSVKKIDFDIKCSALTK